jgi:two-component system sensor histidine kinase PilS (NtrC family)
MASASETPAAGGAAAPPFAAPSRAALRWLLGIRLVVISTLFLGILIIQVNTQQLLQLEEFYWLILLSYGLSLGYLVLYLKGLSTRLQAVVQLLGDIGVVTGFVYFTGGLYSPFSFLYLTVIMVAATLLRGGGLVFAGLSAIAYGILVDVMVFGILAPPASLSGIVVPLSSSRVLSQIMIHVVGFVLVALLVSFLSESLRTARHRLREETERAQQFVALTDQVVRSVSAGILAADLEGKVLHVNPAGARILMIPDASGVVGKPLEEVMPLVVHSWPLLRTRARTELLGRLEDDLGDSGIRLGLSVGPLEDARSSLVGFIVNFQDLTALEIETERRRMRDRMAAVGEMAARMAHEIKNPLASISGSAQVLRSFGGLDATGHRLLNILVDESGRLSQILDEFLDYTRPHQATHKPCNIAAMLRDCMDLLRRSAEITDRHELVVDTPDELIVHGEEHLLRQLFWNLSRNAIQAMPDGGRLTVSAERRKSNAILVWSDTGVGMSEDVRQRAFEPFMTTNPHGTGLGLAVVYTAVEDHGGSIDIDSAPGRGTTITVELPLLPEVA